jgi:hypothetical protein
MVGAKQFAIHRKVTPVKRVNPILAAIKLPSSMKSNEDELDDTSSFLNKYKREPFSLAKMIQEKQPVSRPSTPKVIHQPKVVHEHKEEENKNEDISDELANRITCKVLKNIKNYLNPQREMGMASRHIKLEISL